MSSRCSWTRERLRHHLRCLRVFHVLPSILQFLPAELVAYGGSQELKQVQDRRAPADESVWSEWRLS
jgi:hypothetical protein